MSWEAVAWKDFEDAVRSRWLWGLSAVFVLVVAGSAFALGRISQGQVSSSDVVGGLNGFFVTSLIPLIAVVMGYRAVVGERESGSLKLLLSLPHSRADVVFGKVIGRTGAVAVPVLVGFLLPVIAFLATGVPVEFGRYLGFTLFVVLLAAVFLSFAVGVSAAASTGRRAIAGVVAGYFLLVPLWGAIQFPLQFMLMGGYPGWLSWVPLSPDELFRLLRLLNPTGSFKILTTAFLGGELLAGDAAELKLAAASMLLGWLLLPPLLGLIRFEGRDL